MTKIQAEGAALVAQLVSLPLISWGATADLSVAIVLGATLLVAGLLTLTALRFIDLEERT